MSSKGSARAACDPTPAWPCTVLPTQIRLATARNKSCARDRICLFWIRPGFLAGNPTARFTCLCSSIQNIFAIQSVHAEKSLPGTPMLAQTSLASDSLSRITAVSPWLALPKSYGKAIHQQAPFGMSVVSRFWQEGPMHSLPGAALTWSLPEQRPQPSECGKG